MQWTDGSSYQGEWIKGIQHGFGRMKFTNDNSEEGYFENNTFMIRMLITDSKGNFLKSGGRPPPGAERALEMQRNSISVICEQEETP